VLVQPDLSQPGILVSGIGDVQIAGDGHGNAVAVWDQVFPDAGSSSEPYVIYTSVLSADGGWTTPVRLDLDDPAAGGNHNLTFLNPTVASDGAGGVLAAWSQFDWALGYDRLWLAHYSVQQGWSSPEQVFNLALNLPAVAVDASGNALLSWQAYGGSTAVYVARRLADGGLPAAPTLIENAQEFFPRVSLSSDGQTGFLAYRSGSALRAVQGFPDGGWGAPVTVAPLWDAGGPPALLQYQLAGANDGTAFLAWTYSVDANTTRILASRFSSGAWGAEEDLAGSIPGVSMSPSIGVDNSGNAVATWIHFDGGSWVYANRFVPGAGWGAPVQVSGELSATYGLEQDTAVSVRPDGDAIVIYSSGSVTSTKIYAAHFSAAAGWGAEQSIDTVDPGQSFLHSSGAFINTRNGSVCWTSPTSATAVWSHVDAAGHDATVYGASFP
jgi:hypothetical protein